MSTSKISVEKQPIFNILVCCLDEYGNHNYTFNHIQIFNEWDNEAEVCFELHTGIDYKKSKGTYLFNNKYPARLVNTMVGNALWAEFEIGIYDFVTMLNECKVTMNEITEYTIKGEMSPLSINYYGMTENDLVFHNENQLNLFSETIDCARAFCSNPPSDNPPKIGELFLYGVGNYKTFAEEIEHPIFKPKMLAAKYAFAKYDKILVDGVYQNQFGTYVGYWDKNGAYNTSDIAYVQKIRSDMQFN